MQLILYDNLYINFCLNKNNFHECLSPLAPTSPHCASFLWQSFLLSCALLLLRPRSKGKSICQRRHGGQWSQLLRAVEVAQVRISLCASCHCLVWELLNWRPSVAGNLLLSNIIHVWKSKSGISTTVTLFVSPRNQSFGVWHICIGRVRSPWWCLFLTWKGGVVLFSPCYQGLSWVWWNLNWEPEPILLMHLVTDHHWWRWKSGYMRNWCYVLWFWDRW